MSAENTTFHYDAVLYDNGCHPQSHPDRLATLATLFGLQPTPVDACSVLELGCGDGSNIIPLAAACPGSQFLGVDLAGAAIAEGQHVVERLGLANIRLEKMNVLDIEEDLGQFDYIIAHGLYSWVPGIVRDKVLEVCRDHLTAHGVCFISYNAYPGYHMRDMVRGMMRLEGHGLAAPADQIRQGRTLIQFLAEAIQTTDPYHTVLKAEWAELSGRPDTVIFHDELSETNQPFYFSEFIERASNCGLRYLAEANFHEMQDFSFPDPVRQILQRCGDDIIAREQLMDFARGRRFRQTLLCRQDAAPQRHVDPAVVDSFFIGSPAAPTSDHPDISGQAIEEFHNPRGLSLEIDYPVGKAALLHLGRIWPALATLPELWAEVRALVGQPVDPTGLRAFLLKSYASDMVEFHLHRPRVSPVAGSHPMASPLSRLQASQGATVTTLNYTRIKISDPLSRFVITLLDGTRDRAELGKELVTFIEHLPQPDEAQAAARGQLLERLPEMLEQCLDSLAYTGLLVATTPE